MTERIDAHHHLWRYARDEYSWIGENMGALARDFLPDDLQSMLSRCGIQGTVVVQAQQSVEETLWLLELAEGSESIRGVVGWAPMASAEFPSVLEKLELHKKLKGLRHLVQDEPDPEFLLRPDFNRGVALLEQHRLTYDILIYERHLPATLSFVDKHPAQVFVLDHVAKPRIREGQLEPWSTDIRELARRENVYCKISGMVTEADWANWCREDLQPYFDVVLDAFGPRRLMVGSDWPVCLLAATPARWFSLVEEFLEQLSSAEQKMIFGGVAREVYSLSRNAGLQIG